MFFHRILFCWLLAGPALFAQSDLRTDYRPLESQAPIPENILSDAYQKTAAEVAQTGRRKRDERTYTSQVNYQLDQLLRSPLVLFNTEINALCDRLLDRLCGDDTALRERLTVYVVRSSVVNAFSTDRGDIFMNIGLLERLATADELAYVLAHELVHARERHNVQNFDFNQAADEDRFAGAEADTEQLLREAQFSRELEMEADLAGLDLYLAAGFDPAAPARVLALLDRSAYLPDRWTFDSLELVELGLAAPHALPAADTAGRATLLTETFEENATGEQTEAGEEAEDRFGSHPATEERLAAIRSRTGLDSTATAAAPAPAPSYAALRDLLHFELLETYVLEGFYPAALYQALWLRERYPDNTWVRESLLYAVYGLGQRASRELPPILPDYDTGEFGRLIQYLNRLDATERALAAVAMLHRAARSQPDTTLISLLYRDAAEDLRYHDRFDPGRFATDSLRADSSRYAYFTDTYRELLRDSTFRNHLTRGERYYASNPANMNEEDRAAFFRRDQKLRLQRQDKGYRLGESSLVIVEPRHYSVNKRGDLLLERSERREARLRANLRAVAERHPLPTDVLDARVNMRAGAIEDYRDSRLLTQWLYQFRADGFRVPRNHLRVLDLQARRGDPAILYLINVRRARTYPAMLNIPILLMAITAPPTLGVVLPYRNRLVRGDLTYLLVVDPRDLRSPMQYQLSQSNMGSSTAQRQTLYWIFDQINRQP